MKLSVVIPCRNEKTHISECIKSIFSSELPENIEMTVIVVDGMSTDGTRDIINELNSIYSNLVLVDNIQQLTPFAFNIGINYKDFEYLQIVGARHIISIDYIIKSINILIYKKEIWCVGGKLINAYTNYESELISRAMSTKFGMGIGNFRTLEKSGITDTVTSPMYHSSVFERIGLFDEELIRNQDDDFNFRIINAGGKIFFNSEISLKYYVRTSIDKLWRQFFQYGYWKVFVNKKHKSLTTIRQLAPPLFVSYLILVFFFLFLPFEVYLITLIPLFVYFLISIYTAIKISEKNSQVFVLIKTFLILHLSYGLGFLSGFSHFILLNKKPSDKQKELSR